MDTSGYCGTVLVSGILDIEQRKTVWYSLEALEDCVVQSWRLERAVWFSPRDLVQSWSSGLEDLDTSG